MGTPELSAVDGATVRRERLAVLSSRARDGDRTAVGDLVRELTPLLWSVARSQGVDRETAEDAVQHAWLTLLRSAAAIRSPEALTSWLVTVTRREAQRLRTQRTQQRPVDPVELPEQPNREPLPEHQVAENEQRAHLWRAVQRLPARCRELLRVVAYADRPDYDAVSQALGMPRGSIGPTRGRCLAKLRTLLDGDPEWSDDE